jgi:hypothetical protein
MYSFSDVYVGWTDDGKVVLGIADVKAAFSLYYGKRLVSMFRSVIRKVERSSWRTSDES